ncbi:GNAT family N-acetyltransferase [Teredinibacter sp. KSP-S5-2]|uniref:GNAT family N-acetyltransferase n=1 Tax=Teredinibacter sp. KSP-S5-2 TaxID=3034506 RepID=UPI0029351EE5|nr:GNAT family N-acetyltransferase [Teredinibacter sp. KSP-S5-2]WNO09092.1 GNAT family N-acetyltransferase [Teredinibacter sp. KSP-S5-2]
MNDRILSDRISLRLHTHSDIIFMRDLYASIREDELALTNFSEAEKVAFIAQQFAAQYQHYIQNYNTDFFNIIELDNQAIGRFFVDYWPNEVRVVDIAIMPKFRNNGIGSYLFNRIFAEATELHKPVTIHVERNNPAKKLYERLGFTDKSQTNEIYILMEWQPSG